MAATFKERIRQFDGKIRAYADELMKCADTHDQQNRQIKMLMEEKDKQKERIARLIKKKGNFQSSIKTCKNCGNDYTEKENFNWSCRVHQSDWGGEMWWCCGKRGKDQPGCKFNKHESKDDESDSELNSFGKKDKQQNAKCVCCKEVGHGIEDCTRDPNLKTNEDVNKDQTRINKIKSFRKLHGDTIVNTTHFIKKSVMVPY